MSIDSSIFLPAFSVILTTFWLFKVSLSVSALVGKALEVAAISIPLRSSRSGSHDHRWSQNVTCDAIPGQLRQWHATHSNRSLSLTLTRLTRGRACRRQQGAIACWCVHWSHTCTRHACFQHIRPPPLLAQQSGAGARPTPKPWAKGLSGMDPIHTSRTFKSQVGGLLVLHITRRLPCQASHPMRSAGPCDHSTWSHVKLPPCTASQSMSMSMRMSKASV